VASIPVSHANEVEEIRHIAIAIKEVDVDQRHIGIVHQDGDEILMLDLAWHHSLRNNPASKSYFWVKPAIHPWRLRQVASVCRKIWRANGANVPYGLSPPNDCFDEATGEFLLGPTRHGLTCATFVVAVFELSGLSLIRGETWPKDREGDREWQESIVEKLTIHGASREHIEAVRQGVGGIRVRPEEVASASTKSTIPVRFDEISDIVVLLLQAIKKKG